MGIYINSVEEIKEEIFEMLNNLEGGVLKKDFDEACKLASEKYKSFGA